MNDSIKKVRAPRNFRIHMSVIWFSILLLLFAVEDGAAYIITFQAGYNLSLGEMAELISHISGTQVVYEIPDEIESKGYSKATRALMDATKLHCVGWQPIFDDMQAISEKRLIF